MYRWIPFVALVGCGSRPDDCTAIKDKVRPVLAAMAADAKKQLAPEESEHLLAPFCEPPRNANDKRMRACLVDASDQPAVAACLEVEFKAYRDATVTHAQPQLDKIAKEAKAYYDQHTDDAATPPPIDAPPPDAAPVAQPIDPATLPEIALVDRTPGVETEVLVVDAPASRVLLGVWPEDSAMIAVTVTTPITGRLLAPSRAAAAHALAKLAGTDAHPLPRRGSARTVDLDFAGAPQRDLVRLLGDVMNANIVLPAGALPDVDVVAKRIPADAVLDALASLDGLTQTKRGNAIYLHPRDTKIGMSSIGGPIVDLHLFHATAREATAALAAVEDITQRACDGGDIELRVAHLTTREAIQAIEHAGGMITVAKAPCPIPETATIDRTAVLVAVASAGDKRVAIIRTGDTAALVRPGGNITIDGRLLMVKDREVLPAGQKPFWMPMQDRAEWLASITRTAAVIRIGKVWKAVFVRRDGELVYFAPDMPVSLPEDLLRTPPTVDRAGVELHGGDPAPIRIPLRK